MEIIKRINSLITCLMIIAMFPLCSMDELPKTTQLGTWVLIAGDVILGKKSIQVFQKMTKVKPINSSEESFMSLPKKTRKKIIHLLPMIPHAKDLGSVRQSIELLTQTSQQLNQLLNQPAFSLQLIKSLSAQFNIDNETVCTYLPTQEAQRLLRIQTTLRKLCGTHRLKDFRTSYQQGADPNFTYKNDMTLLLSCIMNDDILLLRFLLKKGANPNFVSRENGTPLLVSARLNKPQAVAFLLETGADPELSDDMGTTPLAEAYYRKNDEIIKLLNKAIGPQWK